MRRSIYEVLSKLGRSLVWLVNRQHNQPELGSSEGYRWEFQIYLLHVCYTQVTVHFRKMIWRSVSRRAKDAVFRTEPLCVVVAFGGFPKSSTCLLFLHWNLVSGFPIWKNVSSMTTAPIQRGLASAPCVGVEGWADVPHGTLSHREWLKWAPENGRLILNGHMTSISFTKWESNLLMEDFPLFLTSLLLVGISDGQVLSCFIFWRVFFNMPSWLVHSIFTLARSWDRGAPSHESRRSS